jgi:hypothetical protein
VATSSEQRMRFMEPLSFGWRMRDQAAACERRSHSSKPMRPRRASPNGTKPAKIRALSYEAAIDQLMRQTKKWGFATDQS